MNYYFTEEATSALAGLDGGPLITGRSNWNLEMLGPVETLRTGQEPSTNRTQQWHLARLEPWLATLVGS